MHSARFRIALWQCHAAPAVGLSRLGAVADDVAADGANVLVCPEMFVSGYNIGPDAVRRSAQAPDGPIGKQIGAIAKQAGIAIAYGFPELDTDSGAVFNSVRLVDKLGTTQAVHRKTHLFGELDRRAVTPGDRPPPVVTIDGWRLGLLVCYEVEFPEMVRALAVGGAELICVPTANMITYEAVQDVLLPARALESQVFLGYANYCGREGDLEYGGHSMIVAPTGTTLARAGVEPEIIVADLDRAVLEKSRRRYPYLRDRRRDFS